MVILAATILTFATWQTFSKPTSIALNESEILLRLANFSEVAPYIAANYSANVTALSQEEISELAQTQPVIYANLTGGQLYRVEFKSPAGDGLLVIYSAAENKILRTFRIVSMQIGE